MVTTPEPARQGPRSRSRAAGWLLVLAAPAAGLAAVLLPAWYVQPFRPQEPGALDRALMLREISPALTLVAAIAAAILAASLWTGSRGRLRRLVLAASVLAAAGAALLARVNHFELMFAQPSAVRFARAQDVDFVEDSDVVLAVTLESQGDAVAFPVRQMAHHHIVQEEVGGIPVVATY